MPQPAKSRNAGGHFPGLWDRPQFCVVGTCQQHGAESPGGEMSSGARSGLAHTEVPSSSGLLQEGCQPEQLQHKNTAGPVGVRCSQDQGINWALSPWISIAQAGLSQNREPNYSGFFQKDTLKKQK